VFLELIKDVPTLKADEAENDVFVFRRIHVVALLVGSEPHLGLESGIGCGFRARGVG
jgi:hypothetical protein